MRDLTKEIDKIIIEWLKSGNENTTYLAHLINEYVQKQSK